MMDPVMLARQNHVEILECCDPSRKAKVGMRPFVKLQHKHIQHCVTSATSVHLQHKHIQHCVTSATSVHLQHKHIQHCVTTATSVHLTLKEIQSNFMA